ncbi:MAG: phosphoribosyltransferase [Alphaproteobacteria bacterium]|nr:MAG: phosphoribosyltransferase [Alphaproteobacteria bacterium]
MFEDRNAAGQALASALVARRDNFPNACIVALPRGGVPVAAPVAAALGCPMDILMVRKIGAPGQSELAVGAVAEGDPPYVTVNPDIMDAFSVSDLYIQAQVTRLAARMRARRQRLGGGGHTGRIIGQSVILIDDGMATGASMRVAIEAVRAAQAHSITVAVPVAAAEVVDMMRGTVDDLIVLETPVPFRAVGVHYRHFDQVSDRTVAHLMHTAAENCAGQRG